MDNLQIKQETEEPVNNDAAETERSFEHQCQFCDFSTKFKKSLRRHVNAKHKDELGDSNSDFVDDDDDEYGEEINKETLQTDSETDREEDSYSTEEEVKPVRKPRGKRKKVSKVCCPTCNEKFASQEKFLSHMSNVHLKIAEFQCCICSLNFGRRHVLLVHMMTVHKFEADQAENLVMEQLKDINMGSRDVIAEIQENDAITEDAANDFWPETSSDFGFRKRKMKEEPDFFYEPEVIVKYPLLGEGVRDADDDDNQNYNEDEESTPLRANRRNRRTRNSFQNVQVKEELKLVACPVCGVERREERMEAHLKNTHTAEETQTCERCSKTFPNKNLLRNHELKIHRLHSAPHACSRCDETFKKLVSLKYHMKSEHNEVIGPQTTIRPGPRKEPEGDPRQPYICEQCGQTYCRRDTLRNHVKKRHSGLPEGQHLCPECPRKFFAKRDLSNHVRTTHDKSPTEPCSICHKGYTPQQMKRHLRMTHSAEISQQCDICNAMLHNRRSLEIHRYSVHVNTEPKIICPQCGNKFKEKRSMELHIRHTHEKLRPFICELCGRGFEGAGRMKRHFRVVHLKIQRELKHACDQCDYKAKDLHLLVKHKVRLHGMEKTHHCDKCPKSYAVRSQLSEHIRVFHEGIMIKCAECDREFTNTNTMYKHKRVVHQNGGKPHKCTECTMSFSMEQYLMKHLRATHKISPDLLDYPLKPFSIN